DNLNSLLQNYLSPVRDFVDEIPDGGEIILQKAVEVIPGDTPESLQKRVMEQAEWVLLPKAVALLSKTM
ncbi:MAG: hypothetical protein GX824_02155, partial [Clostridiales bacterium]|nr:hypothetical protein [Clostridiales bacterium]